MFRTPAWKRVFIGVRKYHSGDQPASNLIIDASRIENKLLTKSLEYIPKYGFSDKCITDAIKELNYSDSIQSVLNASQGSSSSELQLMIHWLKTQRQNLIHDISDENSDFHKISDEYDRATYLINKRLLYNAPIINQLQQGISHLILPFNMPLALEELGNLGDDIAFYAGDNSHDFAWYAKRFSVSTVYVSSELYMLQDKSPNFENTKKFVTERVKKIDQLGETYDTFEKWAFFNSIAAFNLIKSQLARG